MKKLITILTLLLITSNVLLCQWFSQNSGTQYTLYSIDFLTANNGWIAGSENIIKHSTNGGSSWADYSGYTWPPHEIWYSISFVSTNDIYVCGKTYNVDRYQSNWTLSTNGGNNWSSQTAWGSDYSAWLDVFFLDQNIGYKVGYRSGDGRCYKKSGGVSGTWELKLTIDEFLNSVFFINENIGWVVGDGGVIYNTTNGGTDWTPQSSNTTKPLNSVYFIDSNTGWCVGDDNNEAVILKTTNGGQDWSSTLPVGVLKLNSVRFVNTSVGWACGSIVSQAEERGVILYTENGGQIWEAQHIEDQLSIIYDLDFVDSKTGWAVGTDGILLKTTNGGITDIPDELNTMPQDFSLAQNFPNPFNPITTIAYSVPKQSDVKLSVYNILGKHVATLINEIKQPGNYKVEFDGSNLTSGIYFYRLETESFNQTKKLLLLK